MLSLEPGFLPALADRLLIDEWSYYLGFDPYKVSADTLAMCLSHELFPRPLLLVAVFQRRPVPPPWHVPIGRRLPAEASRRLNANVNWTLLPIVWKPTKSSLQRFRDLLLRWSPREGPAAVETQTNAGLIAGTAFNFRNPLKSSG